MYSKTLLDMAWWSLVDWWTTLQFLTCVHDIVGLKKNGVEGDILITRVTFVAFFCGMREVAR